MIFSSPRVEMENREPDHRHGLDSPPNTTHDKSPALTHSPHRVRGDHDRDSLTPAKY